MSQQHEIARRLQLRAGWLKNQAPQNMRECSVAKWYATESAFETASQTLSAHGAYMTTVTSRMGNASCAMRAGR
jgi:alkylation response protein AidB-like acyl-CoA dehydrogenase